MGTTCVSIKLTSVIFGVADYFGVSFTFQKRFPTPRTVTAVTCIMMSSTDGSDYNDVPEIESLLKMKIENEELKKRVTESEEKRSRDLEEYQTTMESLQEVHAKTVSKLEREVILAQDRAQMIEWDKDELQIKVEEQRQQIVRMDAHIEELAYGFDFHRELSTLLEGRLQQLEAGMASSNEDLLVCEADASLESTKGLVQAQYEVDTLLKLNQVIASLDKMGEENLKKKRLQDATETPAAGKDAGQSDHTESSTEKESASCDLM